MPKYKVEVEGASYSRGFVIVEADSPWCASGIVEDRLYADDDEFLDKITWEDCEKGDIDVGVVSEIKEEK